jgi:sporulation protein YlmC with PRC-barrel domain
VSYNEAMQVLASNIKNLPVVSLQTGSTIAYAHEPVVDHAKLEVVAIQCTIPHQHQPLALLARDIRQLTAEHLVVDSEDELIDPYEVVRLASLIKAHFRLQEKSVISDLGRRLGRISNYAIDLESNRIQKLYVRPSGMQAWLSSELTIDRMQIIDITPKHIIVRDSAMTAPLLPPEAIPGNPG